MKTLAILIFSVLLINPVIKAQDNTWSQDKVNEFVTRSMSANLLLSALGDLSRDKSASQAIKDLTRLETRDHVKAEETLKTSVTVAIPVAMLAEHKREIDRLNNKTGEDFDKELLDIVVRTHENAKDEYERASGNLKEAALSKWVTEQISVNEQHLERARELRKELD